MKYEDAEGKTQEAHLDGMMSRICQHEYDHTIGRNFTEHVSKFKLKRAQEKAIKEIDTELRDTWHRIKLDILTLFLVGYTL